jgi:hypothetical protein
MSNINQDPPKDSRPENDEAWETFMKGHTRKESYLSGDNDDEATILIDHCTKLMISMCDFAAIVLEIINKGSELEENIDIPIHYRKVFDLIDPLNGSMDFLYKMMTHMRIIADIRQQYGTITAFENLSSQQKRDILESEEIKSEELKILLTLLNILNEQNR